MLSRGTLSRGTLSRGTLSPGTLPRGTLSRGEGNGYIFMFYNDSLYIMHNVTYQERDCRTVRMLNVLRPDKDQVKTRLRSPG